MAGEGANGGEQLTGREHNTEDTDMNRAALTAVVPGGDWPLRGGAADERGPGPVREARGGQVGARRTPVHRRWQAAVQVGDRGCRGGGRRLGGPGGQAEGPPADKDADASTHRLRGWELVSSNPYHDTHVWTFKRKIPPK